MGFFYRDISFMEKHSEFVFQPEILVVFTFFSGHYFIAIVSSGGNYPDFFSEVIACP